MLGAEGPAESQPSGRGFADAPVFTLRSGGGTAILCPPGGGRAGLRGRPGERRVAARRCADAAESRRGAGLRERSAGCAGASGERSGLELLCSAPRADRGSRLRRAGGLPSPASKPPDSSVLY